MFENIRAAWTNFSHFQNIKHRNNDTWKGFIQWGTHKFSKGGRQYLNNESRIKEFQKKLVHHHDFFSKKTLSDREFDLPQNAEPRVEFKTNTNTNWYQRRTSTSKCDCFEYKNNVPTYILPQVDRIFVQYLHTSSWH